MTPISFTTDNLLLVVILLLMGNGLNSHLEAKREDVDDELTFVRYGLFVELVASWVRQVGRCVLEELRHRDRGLIIKTTPEYLQHQMEEGLFNERPIIVSNCSSLKLIESLKRTLN